MPAVRLRFSSIRTPWDYAGLLPRFGWMTHQAAPPASRRGVWVRVRGMEWPVLRDLLTGLVRSPLWTLREEDHPTEEWLVSVTLCPWRKVPLMWEMDRKVTSVQ